MVSATWCERSVADIGCFIAATTAAASTAGKATTTASATNTESTAASETAAATCTRGIAATVTESLAYVVKEAKQQLTRTPVPTERSTWCRAANELAAGTWITSIGWCAGPFAIIDFAAAAATD